MTPVVVKVSTQNNQTYQACYSVSKNGISKEAASAPAVNITRMPRNYSREEITQAINALQSEGSDDPKHKEVAAWALIRLKELVKDSKYRMNDLDVKICNYYGAQRSSACMQAAWAAYYRS